MSKRELSRLIGTADVEGSRLKRRRDAPMPSSSSPDVDVVMSDSLAEDYKQNGNSSYVGAQTVKEQGLQLWRATKDAESKDGRLLATDFLKKPPRRLYPDYYQIIRKPIALDDIKKKLDTNGYASMEAVRDDFELLFNNALEYNMKDSAIWKDAKDLLKLVHKTYSNLVPSADDDDNSDGEEKKGKSKVPNLNRTIKSKLQKLVDKTDKTGRVMSAEFMELPNKKQWAIYYKEIKRPQCLENIFKRIKRKEYHTAAAFAADVELVFSNAMTFNQEHTPIWEDALALRDYFRQLMSDLPPPHALPEYSNKIIPNKIKIKPPVAPTNLQSDSTSKLEPSSSTLLLRVPAASAGAIKFSQPITTSPATKAKTLPSSTALPTSASAIPTARSPLAPQPQLPPQQLQLPIPQPAAKSATPQPTTATQSTNFAYSHYSHYQPISSAAVAAPSASTTSTIKTAPTTSDSPTPTSMHPNHQIKSVKVKVQPWGRLFWLDHREGVKTWAMRLAPGETGVHIDDLVFIGDEEIEESSEDEDDDDLKQEEEEEDMDIDGASSPMKNGKTKKGKTAIRRSQRTTTAPTMRTTRSASAVANKNKAQEKQKEVEKVEEVQLKLNGLVVKEKEDKTRQWIVGLPVGSNVVEVGEKGGLMWKVYIDRIAD